MSKKEKGGFCNETTKRQSLQPFTLVTVETEKEADIVLDQRNSIADFVSLGTICLCKSITGANDTTIKVAKFDFSNRLSGITAYLGPKELEIPHDAFITVACDYVQTIANYIGEKDYINNIILGPMASLALSMYMLGEDIGMGTEPHLGSMLRGILPQSWDMTDTIEAQRIAFNFIQKMFEVTVAPLGF